MLKTPPNCVLVAHAPQRTAGKETALAGSGLGGEMVVRLRRVRRLRPCVGKERVSARLGVAGEISAF
jgi:hypothetical protein